jgi:hypothetical protein
MMLLFNRRRWTWLALAVLWSAAPLVRAQTDAPPKPDAPAEPAEPAAPAVPVVTPDQPDPEATSAGEGAQRAIRNVREGVRNAFGQRNSHARNFCLFSARNFPRNLRANCLSANELRRLTSAPHRLRGCAKLRGHLPHTARRVHQPAAGAMHQPGSPHAARFVYHPRGLAGKKCAAREANPLAFCRPLRSTGAANFFPFLVKRGFVERNGQEPGTGSRRNGGGTADDAEGADVEGNVVLRGHGSPLLVLYPRPPRHPRFSNPDGSQRRTCT